MIRTRTGIFEGAGGTVLRWRLWHPDAPRATVLLVHGWGEHAGRYEVFAGGLAGRGYAVFAWDLRGHGTSEGPRGHADRFEDLEEDLGRARLEAADRVREPGLPVVLFGHSLGGLIVLRTLQRDARGVDAAVVSAPWLATAVPVPSFKRRAAGLLDRVWPSLGVPTGTRPEALTRDPAMIRAHREDPLNHTRLSARLFFEVERVQAETRAAAGPAGLPVLVVVPEADPLVDASVTTAFAEARRGGGVERLGLPGLRHEPLNEVERDEVARSIGRWLDAHVPRARG